MSEPRHLIQCAFAAHAGCDQERFIPDTEALPSGWVAIHAYPCCGPCQDYVTDEDYQDWLEVGAKPLCGIALNILAAQKEREAQWNEELRKNGPPPTAFELLERRVSALEAQVALLVPPLAPDAGGETGG